MSKKNKAHPVVENPVVQAPSEPAIQPAVVEPQEAPKTPETPVEAVVPTPAVVDFKEVVKPKAVATLPSGTIMETF